MRDDVHNGPPIRYNRPESLHQASKMAHESVPVTRPSEQRDVPDPRSAIDSFDQPDPSVSPHTSTESDVEPTDGGSGPPCL